MWLNQGYLGFHQALHKDWSMGLPQIGLPMSFKGHEASHETLRPLHHQKIQKVSQLSKIVLHPSQGKTMTKRSQISWF